MDVACLLVTPVDVDLAYLPPGCSCADQPANDPLDGFARSDGCVSCGVLFSTHAGPPARARAHPPA